MLINRCIVVVLISFTTSHTDSLAEASAVSSPEPTDGADLIDSSDLAPTGSIESIEARSWLVVVTTGCAS
jgi:hypothetical protein